MRIQISSLYCFLLCLAGAALGQQVEFKFTGNPLVTHTSAADPDAHVWNGRVYVYCSKDGNLTEHGLGPQDSWTYAYMDGYHVFSTDDMINWIDHGEVLHSRDVAWGQPGWMWAPSAAWNGKQGKDSMYYLYYPHKDWDGEWRVGVAISSSGTPIGPFVDTGAPIEGVIGIDPKVFVDNNGEAYIYHNTASVAKLKSNMIELEETSRAIQYGSNLPESVIFEEGSYMHRRGNMYYYSYSKWSKDEDTMAYYATGKSPLGPFKWRGALAGRKSGAQDHHSVIKFKGKWYYFYHMDTPWSEKDKMGWYGHRRIMCYTRMYYNWDRSIQLIIPSYSYINAGGPRYPAVDDGTTYQYDLWYGPEDSQINGTGEVITGTRDQLIFQSHRVAGNDGTFSYRIPLANARYKVTFKFAELTHEAADMRIFDVSMEGKTVISNLDVVAKVGKHAAYVETHTVKISDNELNLVFTSIVDKSMVSAIKVEKVQTLWSRLNVFD